MTIEPLIEKGSFDPETASLLASAFEVAWETVKKSGSPLAENDNAPLTREIMAKRIIETAQTGERNPQRLVEDAIIFVAQPR
jgi:hypothetical protein